MDDIEAALERLDKSHKIGCTWAFDCPLCADLSTIRQALRERDAQLELAKDIAGEYRRRMMAAENRIEKLEAALTLITQDIRFLAAAPVARQALSTPSEEPDDWHKQDVIQW